MKANVVMRRIRAYRRSIEANAARERSTPSAEVATAAKKERVRLEGMLAAAQSEFSAFILGRVKGPWAAFAQSFRVSP